MTNSILKAADEENASENVEKVPGGVYLCQCGKDLSCGACCGFYNFNFKSGEDFKKIILDRTRRFENVKRDIDSVLKFGEEEIKKIEGLGRLPHKNFHHCPYAGFMGINHEKPGCLIHPLAKNNNNIDLRGLSYYGGLACASYFCPTYYNVDEQRKLIVREAISDWFYYGLIITEDEMINNIFDGLENIMGKKTAPKDYSFEALVILNSILKIKFDWPFKRKNFHPANYFFKDDEKKEIIDPIWKNSKYYPILKSVKALILNDKGLIESNNYIESKLNELAKALTII